MQFTEREEIQGLDMDLFWFDDLDEELGVDFGLFEDEEVHEIGGVIKSPTSRPKNSKPKDRGNPYRNKRKEKQEKRYE